MSKTLISILILLLIQSFTPIPLLALVINITDTNEKVIQSTIYSDDTILLRIVDQTTNDCSNTVVKLKLIYQDGTIKDLEISDNRILAENFCINNPFMIQEDNVEGGITLDGIRIYALQPQLILLTYFCKIEQAEMCGLIIDWSNGIRGDEIQFGQTCMNSAIIVQNLINNNNGGEFLRTCYFSNQTSNQVELKWSRYSIGQFGQAINNQNSIIKGVPQFSPNFSYLFPTGEGGYGIIYSTSDQLTLYFISPLSSASDDNAGPFQLFKSIQTTSSSSSSNIFIYKCGISNVGFGYSCLIFHDNTFVNINFLDSGSVVDTNEFSLSLSTPSIIKVESLYNGGYVILTQVESQSVNGLVVGNNGTTFGNWGMQPSINGVNVTYTGNFGVFTDNNTIWSVAISNGLKLVTNDLLKDYFPNVNNEETKQKIKAFGNIFIESVSPGIENTIPINPSPSTISVTFTNLIELSNANISIWQSDSGRNQDILRQSFSGKSGRDFVSIGNDLKTVTITVFKSTFNIPGAQYYVKIDNGFVKDLRTGQGLLGIRANKWTLITVISNEDIVKESVSSIIRLTPAGTLFFLKLDRKDDFIKEMTKELAETIPINQTRLTVPKHFQFDPNTLEDQIFLRVNVKANDDGLAIVDNSISGSRIVSDLNILISNKDFTLISRGNCSKMLDSKFGSIITPNVWDRYRWILIGVLIGALFIVVLLLGLFFFKSRLRKGRNFIIFMFTIILVDFGLDIAFISEHGRDLKWLYPASVVFLTFPIIINLIFTFRVISAENRNRDFRRWWRHYSKTGLLFTFLSGIDIEALNMIGSGCAGSNRFNAPISNESARRILIVSGIVKILLEDIPQLIIYILYQIYTVVPAIIPILALASCSVVIVSNIIFRICYPPSSSYYYSTAKKQKEQKGKIPQGEYKPDDIETPQIFTTSKGESTPDSEHFVTIDNGDARFFIRHPKEFQSPPLKTTPSQGKIVGESIVKAGDDDVGDGKSVGGRSERTKSGVAIIESTEHPIIVGSTETSADQGDTGGYQSRMIEQLDMEPEDIGVSSKKG